MNPDITDFYSILKIDKNASHDQIRSSYKRLAKRYHPDKNSNDDATLTFQRIQIAYETLIDEEKRAKYDKIDFMDHNTELKDLFMYYHELIIEICNNYELTECEKNEIIELFDPADYQNELANNNTEAANQKLYGKLIAFIPKFAMGKITEQYPYLGGLINFVSNYF